MRVHYDSLHAALPSIGHGARGARGERRSAAHVAAECDQIVAVPHVYAIDERVVEQLRSMMHFAQGTAGHGVVWRAHDGRVGLLEWAFMQGVAEAVHEHVAARILRVALLHLREDDLLGLVHGDFLPLRINIEALLRVCALHGHLATVGII